MPLPGDLFQRLKTAIADRYVIERELGHGGMATVYLARDLRHNRQVAVKVLRPELTVAVGAERFLREIEIAARLTHPHILPLHDSGEADGFLYYVMPYVEGDSLRTKLAREAVLPIPDAIRILRDVVDALAFAHQHGVVHRDIKPDNVLVLDRHAVVTDFGVAKAVNEATGRGALTSVGVALGTPAYMAPEQASADPNTDHRADIYAVGAMAYEMLTGRTLFTATTPQAMLAAHVGDTPEPITRHRSTVPPALAELVMRCLQKKAADRWQTAAELLSRLEALTTPSTGTVPTAALRAAPRWKAARTLLVGAVVGVAVLAAVLWPRGNRGPAPDVNAIAVLPFRLSSADTSLAWLREGIIDLLAAKLTGEGGPRAADPRTVMAAWRRAVGSEHGELAEEASVVLARRIGAGRVMLGAIVSTPGRLTLNARVLGVPGGQTRSEVSIQGSTAPDSLYPLIDRFAAQVLAREAGQAEERLATLTSASLPALRLYLDGQAAYRRGEYRKAFDIFERALETDSTFALAGLGVADAWAWIIPRPPADRRDQGLALAWANRRRLSPRDSLVLVAHVGPRYPELPTEAERLAGWERAVQVAPDRPELWYEMGDVLFHWGALLEADAWLPRAVEAFRRALALDSTFSPVLDHLMDHAAVTGDRPMLERLGYQGLSGQEGTAIVRVWLAAATTGDSAMLQRVRAALPDMSPAVLQSLLSRMQWLTLGLNDAERVADELVRKASSGPERLQALRYLAALALNRGRPSEAQRFLEESADVDNVPGQHHWQQVTAALYGDGDTVAAREAAATLARVATEPPAPGGQQRRSQVLGQCGLEQWRLRNGRTATTAATIQGLRAETGSQAQVARTCAALLEAVWLTEQRSLQAGVALQRFDSIMRSVPVGIEQPPLVHGWNLVAARLWASRGDFSRALGAARRRSYMLFPPVYYATMLREEGRLAALVADREGAISAYQRYLALRSDPEPALAAEVAEVRAELAKLVGEPTSPSR